MAVDEHLEEVDGQPIFWRTAPGLDPPVLYVHGVPESADMWEPFLARTGGLALDLPGFGRSSKRGDFDYTIEGYGRWLERFLDHVGVERFRLACHDWGAVALEPAQRAPERVERLALINVVPFLPGYRWHRVARIWRRRGPGELFMGASNRWAIRALSGVPREMADGWWRHFDQGTQRAILRLYRGASEETLAAAGAGLNRIAAPALVLWGEDDPYLPARFADELAARLPAGRARRVPGAGHWPWFEDPRVVDEVCDFLAG